MAKSLENNLAEGNVFKKLVSFAMPILLANILQMLYSLVDTLVVGRIVGSAGISAVTIGSQLAQIFLCIGMGYANGAQVVISQLKGANDREGMKSAIGSLLSISVILGIVTGVIGVIITEPTLKLMNTQPEAWDQAVDYMIISCIGMVFVFLYNAISCIMRGLGDSTRPLIFVAIASVINIVLDIVFVGPFGMGAGGAALATILAQCLSALFGFVYLYRRRAEFVFDFKPRSFAIKSKWVRELSRMGIPQIVQMGAISISMMYVLAMVNVYGIVATSTVGVANKIMNIFTMPFHATSTASCSMAGQNAGAGRYDRVKQVVHITLLINIVMLGISTFFTFLFGEQMVGFFDTDPEVIKYGAQYLRIQFFCMVGHTMFCSFNATCLGIGNALLSTIAFLMDGVFARLALCILSVYVFDWGLVGIFWANSIPACVCGLILLVYYLSGRWKTYKSAVLRGSAQV